MDKTAEQIVREKLGWWIDTIGGLQFKRGFHHNANEFEVSAFNFAVKQEAELQASQERVKQLEQALENSNELLLSRAEQGFEKWRNAVAQNAAILRRGEK